MTGAHPLPRHGSQDPSPARHPVPPAVPHRPSLGSPSHLLRAEVHALVHGHVWHGGRHGQGQGEVAGPAEAASEDRAAICRARGERAVRSRRENHLPTEALLKREPREGESLARDRTVKQKWRRTSWRAQCSPPPWHLPAIRVTEMFLRGHLIPGSLSACLGLASSFSTTATPRSGRWEMPGGADRTSSGGG